MKTILYWFSGTGNSLSIARSLAHELGNTELVPIATTSRNAVAIAERIGIVFPVYAFGLPDIVWHFIPNIPASDEIYYFSVATMGGIAGGAHRQVRNQFRTVGAKLAAGWSVVMPGNYTPLYGAPPIEKQKAILNRANIRVRQIASEITQGISGRFEDSLPLLSWIASLANRKSASQFKIADRNYYVNDSCIHCGRCATVCPVENIHMVSGRPVWMHHCQQCMACLQWCPVESIQMGRLTVSRKRYHHPDILPMDLALRDRQDQK